MKIISLKYLASLGVVLLSMTILLVSASRASLEMVQKQEGDDKVRVAPVLSSQGEVIYKLPQANILPDNPLYFFKSLRDSLWLEYSRGNQKKGEMYLLLADKKMAEARELEKKGNEKMALEASEEAFNKLKYAKELLSFAKEDPASRQFDFQIQVAGGAYLEIVKGIENSHDLQEKIKEFQKENF